MFGSSWRELHLLDQVLSQLTRPAPVGASLPGALRDQLRTLGLPLGRAHHRQELIAQVWGRKRPLMRQLYAIDEDPIPPCA